MILRVSGKEVAKKALSGNYIGNPYSRWDCQAFVEQVLKDLGVRKPDGSIYNWKGSNSMFRNLIRWRGTIEECKRKFGCIPLGAFVFIVKHDGGEIARGYHDDLGNSSHVGLYVGASPNPVMDSQPEGGVQLRRLEIFTHVGLMEMIDYSTNSDKPDDPAYPVLEAVKALRNPLTMDSEYLTALRTLTNYLKGDNI